MRFLQNVFSRFIGSSENEFFLRIRWKTKHDKRKEKKVYVDYKKSKRMKKRESAEPFKESKLNTFQIFCVDVCLIANENH